MPRGGPSKYQPLADYLAAQPAAVGSLTLTFPEIEAIVGAPLPPTAERATFWANARQPRAALSQVRAVQGVGWRMGGVWWGPGGVRAVRFVRGSEPPAHEKPPRRPLG